MVSLFPYAIPPVLINHIILLLRCAHLNLVGCRLLASSSHQHKFNVDARRHSVWFDSARRPSNGVAAAMRLLPPPFPSLLAPRRSSPLPSPSSTQPDDSSARDASSGGTLFSYGRRIAPARDAVADPSNSDDDDHDDNDDMCCVIVEDDSYEGRLSALFSPSPP
jgi:hypothetical protein